MSLSLWNAAVMLAVGACTAVASSQDPVEVVGTIAAEIVDEFESTSNSASGALATGSDDWKAYEGLPMVGTLLDTDNDRVLAIGGYSSDRRDVNSLYACVIKARKPVVLLNHPAGEGEPAGGVVIEVVENRSRSGRGKTDGWFLAVRADYGKDTMYDGTVRLMAHRDPAKAAIFKYTTVDDKSVLQLVGNRDPAGLEAIGGYLMVPDGAKRDSQSFFVAVSLVKSIDGALGVTLKSTKSNLVW